MSSENHDVLISVVTDKLLPSLQRHFPVKVKAARRTAAGGFNNAVFKKIGGKDCPRYAALTWKERDKVHDEIPAVKARYERHLAKARRN
jgi:hypothetical protein